MRSKDAVGLTNGWENSALSNARRYYALARHILGKIAAGDLEPGERLPSDRDLADAAGISRPIVREAILVLELIGAVEIKQGDGVFVKSTGSIELDEKLIMMGPPNVFMEARSHIEPQTASLAAVNIREDEIEVLARLVDESLKIVNDADKVGRLAELQGEFHQQISNMCGNPIMTEIVNQLLLVETHPLWNLINMHTLRFDKFRIRQIDDHVRILSAIRNRDAPAAAEAMREHICIWIENTLLV